MVSSDRGSSFRLFRAGHISTPLGEALAIEVEEDPARAADLLSQHRFDQAPVRHSGHIVGWVLTQSLFGVSSVMSALRPLQDCAIVSTDAPIADVLELLSKEGLVFTVGDLGLSGFVTPSDLDRHAVRSHFYLLVAAVEMALADIVRHAVSEDQVIARIRGDLLNRWRVATAENREADAVEYLYLGDLTALFLETHWSEAIIDLRPTLTELCQFRRIVMHPARQVTAGGSPEALACLARRGEDLVRVLDGLVKEVTGQQRWR